MPGIVHRVEPMAMHDIEWAPLSGLHPMGSTEWAPLGGLHPMDSTVVRTG
ncbi:hypothetical protein ACGFZA_40525 [Streptomyces sp. NPDC048211]